MRVETSGKYGWRTNLYDDVGELLDENTRSGAIDGACEFTKEILPALERTIEHPDMTEELAEVFLTSVVDIKYRVETRIIVE